MNIHFIQYQLQKMNYLALLFLVFSSATAIAADHIELDTTSIVGNKELPKILYIVPWKNAELPDMSAPPIDRLIDESLAPVDRQALKRQVRYFQIYSRKTKNTE